MISFSAAETATNAKKKKKKRRTGVAGMNGISDAFTAIDSSNSFWVFEPRNLAVGGSNKGFKAVDAVVRDEF